MGHAPLALLRLAKGFKLLSAARELGLSREQGGLLFPQHVEPFTCGGGQGRRSRGLIPMENRGLPTRCKCLRDYSKSLVNIFYRLLEPGQNTSNEINFTIG